MRKSPLSGPFSSAGEPNVTPNLNHKSLDEYLEEAYSSNNGIPWSYWLIMWSLGIANSSDASEILCLSFILSDQNFQDEILRDDPWKAGLLAASVFFGMLMGGLFVGTIGDWVGRRPTLLVGLICNSVAGVLSAAAQTSLQLSILRCCAGVGIGATIPPLFTLVTELSPPSRRGFFVTFCASFWMVGSIFVAVVALLVLEYCKMSWRVFAIVCAIPSAVGAILVLAVVPESPRFLAIQGKYHEALVVANTLAQNMRFEGTPMSLTELLHFYPRSSQVQHPQRTVPTSTGCTWFCGIMWMAMLDFRSSTSTLYQPLLRPVTWPLQTVWFSLCFGSYGILTWINSLFVAVKLENVYFNALLFAFSNLPGNLVSAFFMDRTGRKCMLSSSCLAAALSLLSFAYFASQSSLNTIAIVTSACTFQACTIVAWNTLGCMTSELFPTAVRSTGMGMCAASGRVGAMVAQFVNGALVGNPARLLLVASASLVIGAMTPFLLPAGDMSQRPLEDTFVVQRGSTEEEQMVLRDHEDEITFVVNKSNDNAHDHGIERNRII